MKYLYLAALCLSFITASTLLKASDTLQYNRNDSLILAQAYINLSLTQTYFDSLSIERIKIILPYVESKLNSIHDTNFIYNNRKLYNFTYSLLHYNKANLLFKNRSIINRDTLVNWHNELTKAIKHFNDAQIDPIAVPITKNKYFESIKFDIRAGNTLFLNIQQLKSQFSPFFMDDIYPEFKRVFYTAKNLERFDLDSLLSFTSIYNISINLSILERPSNEYYYNSGRPYSILNIENEYPIELKLNLITRYLQLKYLATDTAARLIYDSNLVYDSYQIPLYDAYSIFREDLDNAQFSNTDDFFKDELNTDVCDKLGQELENNFSYVYVNQEPENKDYLGSSGSKKYKYFFPNPVPQPSAIETIPNYKPNFETLGRVNDHLISYLHASGYYSLHYYYHLDGFAVATSLEKFYRDGTEVSSDQRWVKNLGADNEFSYYDIFKSLFFETKSDFRIFVFLVSSKEASTKKDTLSAGGIEEILKKSYPSLPNDLKDVTLEYKNLTILVYHFFQSDIGQVPELDLSKKMTLNDYFINTNLNNNMK